MERFQAAKHNNVWFVKDNRANDLINPVMPEKACTLYFRTSFRAETIANLMNAEWKEFLNKPE